MNSRKPISGILIGAIGAIHTALGVVTWASAPPNATPDQLMLAFWFTIFGVLAIGLGLATGELERRGYVPPTVLAALAVVIVFGLVVEPASGFWSLLVPLVIGTVGWLRSRRSVDGPRPDAPVGAAR